MFRLPFAKFTFNSAKLIRLSTVIIFVGLFCFSCTSSKQFAEDDRVEITSSNETAANDTTNNTNLIINVQNVNSLIITDVDVFEFYNAQAQRVFDLYVEAQNQFSNMRYFNALELLERSNRVVPTMQAYYLQVMIYQKIGDYEKMYQAYDDAKELNDAMGEDLLLPIELLTGISASNE